MKLFLLVMVALSFGFYSGEAFAKIKVAFTVDDLPEHSELPKGLDRYTVAKKFIDVFTAHHLPEVYGFINGINVDPVPDHYKILKMWRDAGFLLGNHTYSHLHLDKLSLKKYEKEIEGNEHILKALAGGSDWHYFRYPFLEEGGTLEKRNGVRKLLFDRGYKIAQVTMDFDDWAWDEPYARCKNKQDENSVQWLKETYLANALEKLKQSDQLGKVLFKRQIPQILLMHIGGMDAYALEDLINLYLNNDVEFITLSEAMKDPIFAIDPQSTKDEGTSFLGQIMNSRGLTESDVGMNLTEEPYYDADKLAKICN